MDTFSDAHSEAVFTSKVLFLCAISYIYYILWNMWVCSMAVVQYYGALIRWAKIEPMVTMNAKLHAKMFNNLFRTQMILNPQ